MIMYSREMAEPTIPHRLFTLEQEGGNDDDQDLEDEDDDREELADDEKDRDTTAPTTPEPPTEVNKLLHSLTLLAYQITPTKPLALVPPCGEIVLSI